MSLATARLAALRHEHSPVVAPTRRGLTSSAATHRLLREVARRRSGRGMPANAVELAAVLDTVSRRCASGESLTTALGGALAAPAPVAGVAAVSSLAEAATMLGRGATLREALGAVTSTDADVVLAVHVLALCATQGGNVSESLDRAAATLRERQGVRLERDAQSAQARLSARVLTVVPIGFAAWSLATTPTVRTFATTPAGLACMALGATMNLAGWRWMRRTITSTG
jgi:Flp pilus assembly protein TadB